VLVIALKMLFGDRTKFYGVVLGSFLCTFLITHMLSMFNGMMARSYALVTDIPQADIWVMDPAVRYADEPIPISDNALLRVRGVPGVEWATPLFTGTLRVRLPNGGFQGALVIGVDDASLIGLPSNLKQCDPQDIRRADGVFVDVIGARTSLALPVNSPAWAHGPARVDYTGETRPLHLSDEVMVNDHRLIVSGFVDLGPRFLAKPVLYTTYSRAVAISPPTRSLLSFVLVKAKPGEDPTAVAREIEQRTWLRARTSKEFCDDTYWYYMLMTGVVSRIIFMIATAVVVGLSVSSLLFYLFTAENAKYYMTFKTLGTTDRRLVGMVAVQALVGLWSGFGLGTGASCLLGVLLPAEGMPYQLTGSVMGASAGAMLLVAVVASTLSTKRVLKLDPSDVFK